MVPYLKLSMGPGQGRKSEGRIVVLSDLENADGVEMKGRQKISERAAEDHARLLAMVSQRLAEIGIEASLTTFQNLVLYAETFVPPSRYEPELDVLWPGERPGVAVRVKLIERGGQDFYAWGVSCACTHPASDPMGAVQITADAVLAA
jgi:hypothetical protein